METNGCGCFTVLFMIIFASILAGFGFGLVGIFIIVGIPLLVIFGFIKLMQIFLKDDNRPEDPKK